MDIYLAPEYEEYLRQKVESGEYDSPSEIIRDALDLLRRHDHVDRMTLEELRQKIAVGIAQADRGETAPLDMKKILATARERLAQVTRQDLAQLQQKLEELECPDATSATHAGSGS